MVYKISEQIKYKDIDTYKKLKDMSRSKSVNKKKKIELGDTPENLMKHDSHKRIGRRIKQTKWS